MKRLKVLISAPLVALATCIVFVLPAISQESTCAVSMGEYGYDLDSRSSFVKDPTVTSTFLALVGCTGESLPSTHTFTISFNGYSCSPFARGFPENPSGYRGSLPEGYRGSLKVSIGGVGEQSVPIFTSPKRHPACGRRRICRRTLASLTKRETSRLCRELESRIVAPRKIIIIGK
jgi:hypothetical protein